MSVFPIGGQARRLPLLIAVASTLVIAACGSASSSSSSSSGSSASSSSSSSSGSTSSSSFVPITFSLDFSYDGLHSPFIVAQDKGWYKDAGINVTIEPSGGSQDSLTRIATGTAQVGVVASTVALTGIADKHLPVKVVMMLLQHDPSATETRKALNITTPAGLAGHTVATPPGSTEAQLFPALLKANHVDPAKVNTVSISTSAAKASLLAGKVDATNIFGQVFSNETSKVNIIYWYKFGLTLYGSTVTANTSFLAQHPQEMKTFLQVTLRGLQYVVAHPAEAGTLVAQRAKGSAAFFQEEVKAYLPFYAPSAAPNGPGSMDDTKWQETEALNIKYGVQKNTVVPSQVYTNQYLPNGGS